MTALAFNMNGDPFELPPHAHAWRLRKMKPRGAPELVYGQGAPLLLPIDADIEALAEAVGQVGRFRLDAVGVDGKVLDGVPAAYVQVNQLSAAPGVDQSLAPVAIGGGGQLGEGEAASLLRAVLHSNGEVVRSNTELARSIVDRLPEIISGTATLIHAADGAGMPRRTPRVIDVNSSDDDDRDDHDDRDGDDQPPAPRSFVERALAALETFGPMLAPFLQSFAANGGAQVLGAKLGNLAGGMGSLDLGQLLDWRKAAPTPAPSPQRPALDAPATTMNAPATPTPAESGLGALPPHILPMFGAIVMQLAPSERALVMQVAKELPAHERDAWIARLATMTPAEAVAQIRALIAGDGDAIAASPERAS
ncbi:MAG: hypothetical protein JNL83_17925 [Myxococcales bacterium]|nr:hypothetical protein [Myxococcales bacterium]